jgi:hypothetical protein
MASSPSVPWHNLPAREFPPRRWLRERYRFQRSFAPFPLLPARPAGWATSAPRSFPAQVWWQKQLANARQQRSTSPAQI